MVTEDTEYVCMELEYLGPVYRAFSTVRHWQEAHAQHNNCNNRTKHGNTQSIRSYIYIYRQVRTTSGIGYPRKSVITY